MGMTSKQAFVLLAALLVGVVAADLASAQGVATRAESVEVNGIRLHYRTAGSGPPLLLLHGYTGAGAWWDSLSKRFAEDYTVIVPDLPGHGRSEGRSGPYRFDKVAEDLYALMDELGIDRLRAIGYSGGGIALLHMATKEPHRIEAMVVVSASHLLAKHDIRAFPSFEDHPPRVRAYWLKIHPGGEAQVRELIERFHGVADIAEEMNLTPKQLSTIEARTLLVVGDRDSLVPLPLVMEMYQAIPNAALWVVPMKGHSAIWPDWGGSEEAALIFPDVVTRYLGAEALTEGSGK